MIGFLAAALRPAAAGLAAALLFLLWAAPLRAADIQEVRSPGGVTAWLVEEPSIPMLAVEIHFRLTLEIWCRRVGASCADLLAVS